LNLVQRGVNNLASLEKTMLFLPKRLKVHQNNLYVCFNLSPIPEDMVVTSMVLHIPLPPRAGQTVLLLHEVMEPWEDGKAGHTPPLLSHVLEKIVVPAETEEGQLAVPPNRWQPLRNSETNGLFVTIETKEGVGFSGNEPPFLLVGTL